MAGSCFCSTLILATLLPILIMVAGNLAVEAREARSVLHRRSGDRSGASAAAPARLRFKGRRPGEFKILQVADMHYANGRSTGCLDVFPNQTATCSDLNTTAFLYRVIRDERPDLVVFTGAPPNPHLP